MNIEGWNRRYSERRTDDLGAPPTPLLIETAQKLPPGRALDLASGTGRNALWLAQHGWRVSAFEGSNNAVEILRQRAEELGLDIDSRVVDLANKKISFERQAFDLVAICYYLQRDLFEPAKDAVKPGGTLLAIVHITEDDQAPTENRLRPGELRAYFEGWSISHYYEGKSADPAHKRAVAEIVATRP